jgi:hypothetical protein
MNSGRSVERPSFAQIIVAARQAAFQMMPVDAEAATHASTVRAYWTFR